MHPKSKSPSELKHERLRGMCGEARENVRYIPIDNGIQTAWRAWRYTNATRSIFVYDMRTQYTTAITRASQRPGACIACACVRALYYYIIILLYYYNIIILLYYYIYIYQIYPVYPVYLIYQIYPIYPTMVI